VVIALALIVSLAAFGAGGILWWMNRGGGGGGRTPGQAVENYLHALAQADAAAALSYTRTAPADTTFLTSAILQENQANHPIANIEVGEPEKRYSPTYITATYTMGEEEITAEFTVQRHSGRWFLDGGFIDLDISEVNALLPLSINGHDVGNKTRVQLFPGVYTMSVNQPMIAFTNPLMILEYPESHPDYSMDFTLSEEGLAKVDEIASAHLNACINRKEIKPHDCGFGFDGGPELDENSITWTLTGDTPDWATLDYQLDLEDFSSATAWVEIPIKFDALSMDRLDHFGDSTKIQAVRVDLTNPYMITVSFL
jgi:hypothetical protein